MTNRTGVTKNLFLVINSIFCCFFFLLIAELLCRIFCDIPLLGTSRSLFVAKAYGTSKGNAKNTEAVSFSKKVYTDQYGFRVAKGAREDKKSHKEAILILGDSVAFGSGVEEEKTLAGLLRIKLPYLKIYNSSVIGYNTHDYKNIIKHFLPLHPEVKKVYLIFCLNDISFANAQLIDKALNNLKEGSYHKGSLIFALKRIKLVNRLNRFLRSHSKLHLALKYLFTDPQGRYWNIIKAIYEKHYKQNFLKMMQPVIDINNSLKRKKIIFTIIITPYAAQFRNNETGPQDKLSRFFAEHRINYIDVIPDFAKYTEEKKELFLPADPMHLSGEGHRIVYEVILGTL